MSLRQFPPRGSGVNNRAEISPSQTWTNPSSLGSEWDWKPGAVLLGHWKGRKIGRMDDRHIVTVAGNRAGKSRTVLYPNLWSYPGSVLVLDPKGELARATAAARRAMGQQVHVLDPFHASGLPSSSYNPFEELSGSGAMLRADVATCMDAIVINNSKDPHWTDAGKNMMRGITVHMIEKTGKPPTLRQLRRLICSTAEDMTKLFEAMSESPIEAVANVGAAFLEPFLLDVNRMCHGGIPKGAQIRFEWLHRQPGGCHGEGIFG